MHRKYSGNPFFRNQTPSPQPVRSQTQPICTGKEVRRLVQCEEIYRLSNGSTFSFNYFNSTRPQIHTMKASFESGRPIICAGEYNSELFFYAILPCVDNQKETFQGEGTFAVQQPFYLNPTGDTIESFGGDISIKLSEKIDTNAELVFFCCGSDDMSVYSADSNQAYVICGDQLLIIRDDLISLTELDGLKICHAKIAGVNNNKLLINAHGIYAPRNNAQNITPDNFLLEFAIEELLPPTASSPVPRAPSRAGSEGRTMSIQQNLSTLELCGQLHVSTFTSRFQRLFKVNKILGIGSFGVVFEAINEADNETYAVKRVSVDPRGKEFALEEVRAIAKLDHLNIVRYYSMWDESVNMNWQRHCDKQLLEQLSEDMKEKWSRPMKALTSDRKKTMFVYIQMQYCNDRSLADWLEDHQDQKYRELFKMKSWFKQLVSAVAHIHEKNLIHRDIKPENVMFFGSDYMHLKLCDLGLATQRREDHSSCSYICRTDAGTRLYNSPEQETSRYSSKSEIFTLGLVFAELCVVMNQFEKIKIFNDFRNGKQCDLIQDPKAATFVRLLTQIDPDNRPSSQELLTHPFLAYTN